MNVAQIPSVRNKDASQLCVCLETGGDARIEVIL